MRVISVFDNNACLENRTESTGQLSADVLKTHYNLLKVLDIMSH